MSKLQKWSIGHSDHVIWHRWITHRYYCVHINVITNTSTSNRKFLKMNAYHVFYFFKWTKQKEIASIWWNDGYKKNIADCLLDWYNAIWTNFIKLSLVFLRLILSGVEINWGIDQTSVFPLEMSNGGDEKLFNLSCFSKRIAKFQSVI